MDYLKATGWWSVSPAGIISTIIPNVGLGALIAIDPNEHTYSPMLKGVFNSVRIRLLNKTNLQPLSIRDPQFTLIVGLRKKKLICFKKK